MMLMERVLGPGSKSNDFPELSAFPVKVLVQIPLLFFTNIDLEISRFSR